ncbi:MAG: CRISPR system precrRNA processing endoribonuclease RAMP protein Cas6 [Desulfuromonadales bacterium]
MLTPIPSILSTAEFSRLRFLLEFQETVPAGEAVLLRLRRDLLKAARGVLGRSERFNRLFNPPVAEDPLARRRFQRPAPPFVILMPEPVPHRFEAGDALPLPVVFWGQGRQGIADFILIMEAFGESGIHRGAGRFVLRAVEAEATGGHWLPDFWRPGQNPDRLAPPVHDARWWLETSLPAETPLCLRLRTPTRLMANNRPLFQATFARLFPFILRRVTSMLYAHCGIEVTDEPQVLIARAARVNELGNDLVWRDWRVLDGQTHRQELGGLVGALHLGGEELEELRWILGLGTLMNFGKGAAFVAGSYSLT